MTLQIKLAIVRAIAAIGIASLHATAHAQTDARPLRIVVPFAAGGAQDVIGRYMSEKLGPRLGVTILIENKAGAGGVIAADAVAKASPDGATLFLASGGAITVAPHLNPRLPYDAQRDFVPVALVADTPMTIAVRAQSPYKTLPELLRDAAARPRQIAYASTGNGTVSHLTGELLAQAAGVQLLHVPYRGAAPAITDLIGGQVPAIVTSAASIDAMAEAGKARVLASFTAARLAGLNNVPTVAEASGLKGLEVPVWIGFLAPARTPAERLDKLAAEIEAVCKLVETRDKFKGLGALATCGGRAELGRVIAEDFARWERVIKQGGIKVE